MRIPHLTTLNSVIDLLDAIANSPAMMGFDAIDRLCEARRQLAIVVGRDYNLETNSYTPKSRKVKAVCAIKRRDQV